MVGIYKIISPSNKIYIGQSSNIEKRYLEYKQLNCKSQTKLYNSFKKYGVDSHTFEIVCECLIEELNKTERFFQERYNVIGINGLNLRLTCDNDKSGIISEETRLKMSISGKKKKLSEEHKRKLAEAGKKRKDSKETCLKRSKNNKQGKMVMDVTTGIFFDTIKEAAKTYNINQSTLRSWIKGRDPNKSNLILLT